MIANNIRSRFAVALGGFLIFIGIILTSVFIVNFLDIMDFSLTGAENLQNLFLMLIFTIGLLDLIAGIILWRR